MRPTVALLFFSLFLLILPTWKQEDDRKIHLCSLIPGGTNEKVGLQFRISSPKRSYPEHLLLYQPAAILVNRLPSEIPVTSITASHVCFVKIKARISQREQQPNGYLIDDTFELNIQIK